MLGELNVGHMFVGGGDIPEFKQVKVGLLGADYSIENGRYRFAHVYDGENWNPDLRAPLTQPGVNVVGRRISAGRQWPRAAFDRRYLQLFPGNAGKQMLLKVGPNADGTKLPRSDRGSHRQ